MVGAGVVGLTSALRLRQAGHDVAVWAAALSPATTSDVAAALWYPYRVRGAGAWAAESYAEFARLAAAVPEAGVRMRRGRELVHGPAPDPDWAADVADFADFARLDSGGWSFTAPVADTSVYLPWLAARLTALGGTIVVRRIAALGEALSEADLAVNCAGPYAGRLAGDPTVRPVRGQALRVAQSGVTEWVLDQSDPRNLTYVVPRLHDVVLGGTADEDDVERVDPADTAAIRARCAALEPLVADAPLVGPPVVGLRPQRAGGVRLERDGGVIHNYGHGGAGVTLAWGCAGDVARLATGT